MTYLGYSFSNGEIKVVQDTLAIEANDKTPFLCLKKFQYFPQHNCVIAGTGDIYIQVNSWIKAKHVSSLDTLLNELPSFLGKYRENIVNMDYVLSASTVFIFFFEQEKPRVIKFTFDSEKFEPVMDDMSYVLQNGKLAHKPGDVKIYDDKFSEAEREKFRKSHEATFKKIQELENLTSTTREDELLYYGLYSHLSDCSLPQLKQVGIGGDFMLISFSKDGLSKDETIFTFPDNKRHNYPEKLLSTKEALSKLEEKPGL